MKSIQSIACVLVLSLIFTSCYKRNHWGVRGSGSNVSERRVTEKFDRISLSVDADVDFTQDSVFFIEVTGQSNILSVLETRVSGGELHIEYKRDVWEHNRVKLKIHSPSIKGVNISGSGNIRAQNNLKSDFLDLNISGSGNIIIPNLTGKTLTAKISGSGNIEVERGTMDSETLRISGSGNIELPQLVSSTCVTSTSGSGNIIVNVTESLNVNISGSGYVKYRGKPSFSADISGSGKLISIN